MAARQDTGNRGGHRVNEEKLRYCGWWGWLPPKAESGWAVLKLPHMGVKDP